MQKTYSEADLKESIRQLEQKQAEEAIMLKAQFNQSYEQITPVNLVKNAFKQIAGSQDIKDNLLSTSVGLTTGYFSKMLFERISNNPFKKIIGTVLLFGITNGIAKNPEAVRSVGKAIFRLIRRKPVLPVTATDKPVINAG